MTERQDPPRTPGQGEPRSDSFAERIVSGGSRSARRIAGATGLDQAVEDAIVRAVESETTERALARIINGPIVTQAVEEALASKRVEQAVIETVDSEMVDRVWARILASDETELLIKRIAESPEIRDAIASQGVGLVTDIGIEIRAVTARLDDWVERKLAKILRRDPRAKKTERAGFFTRALSIGLDALLLNFLIAFSIALFQAVTSALGLDFTGLGFESLTITGVIWFLAASLYLFSFWNLAGQTPAMRFLGIRIEKDGDWRLPAGTAFKRLIGFWLAAIPFGLGFIGALLRADRRAFDDRVADTAVFFVDPVLPGMPHDRLPEQADTRYRRTAAQQAARSADAAPS
jgi:uncharacterized RDD family membrane protein YckC